MLKRWAASAGRHPLATSRGALSGPAAAAAAAEPLERELSAAEKTAPFGGAKHSSFGREGGREGIDEHLETKHVPVNFVGATDRSTRPPAPGRLSLAHPPRRPMRSSCR